MSRKYHIGLRIDNEEKNEIDENARLLGMLNSEYVRLSIKTINDIMFRIKKRQKGISFAEFLKEKGVLEKNEK